MCARPLTHALACSWVLWVDGRAWPLIVAPPTLPLSDHLGSCPVTRTPRSNQTVHACNFDAAVSRQVRAKSRPFLLVFFFFVPLWRQRGPSQLTAAVLQNPFRVKLASLFSPCVSSFHPLLCLLSPHLLSRPAFHFFPNPLFSLSLSLRRCLH